MAKFFDVMDETQIKFIRKQPVFFVASAPLSGEGHVNLSPKGMDSFRILSPKQVAYLDLTGSGNETSAHLRENGRITFMFCAFTGNPLILRLYGTGRAVLPETVEWDALIPQFQHYAGARQIIAVDVSSVQTSCGFAVPKMEFVEDRQKLVQWAENKGEDGIETYWRQKNTCSIDDLVTPIGERMRAE